MVVFDQGEKLFKVKNVDMDETILNDLFEIKTIQNPLIIGFEITIKGPKNIIHLISLLEPFYSE